jgi:superfamily II RNA helicase
VYYNEVITEIKNNDDFDDQKYKHVYNIWKEDSLKKDQKLKDSVNTKFKKFVEILDEKELFPALFFNFSRKGCEKFAKMIERSLISGKEQTEAINLFDFYVKKYLGESGLQSQQYWMIRALISKGVCVHHSGLIPILKEVVEILFDKKFIRLLFVTETFSVGINMPTKCVVFSELQKFDGKEQRNLNHAEYVQMAGRAGRRGKDVVGNVIYFQISSRNMLTTAEFAQIVRGSNAAVSSKLDIDAKLILRCIDNEKDIEEEFRNTLFSNEIEKSIVGMDYEINDVLKKIDAIQIDETVFAKFRKIQTLENQKAMAKPKKRKTIQIDINSLKKEIGMNTLENIDSRKCLLREKTKLDNQRKDAVCYIKDSIEVKMNELTIQGYLTNDGKTTLKGKAVCCVNEADAFLVIEYLQNVFASYDQKFYTKDDLEYIIPFVLGSLINERDLEEEEAADIVYEVFNDKTKIDNVKYELDLLGKLHADFQSEEQLTPVFGAYVYYWCVEKKSFNEIQNFIPVAFYEGNFVKNILKIHNICEEFLGVVDIFSISPEITEVIKGIQSNLLRDIVTCDSIYIKT